MSGLVVRDLATGPRSALTPTQRLVALCLAHHMRKERECFPSLEAIASWTGLSVSGVRKAIDADALTGKNGFIDKVPRPGRYSSNLYRLREGVTTGHPGAPRVLAQDTLRVLPERSQGVTLSREGATWERQGATTSHVMNQGVRAGSGAGSPAELIPIKAGIEPWLVVARSIWSEGIGAPPSWLENDLRPLVTPSRTSGEVLAALRAYVSTTEPIDASTRKFAERVAAWLRAARRRTEPETMEEKTRRYLEADEVAS